MKALRMDSIKNISRFLVYTLLFLLPTQLGQFFFLNFSFISGVRIDYLAPVIFLSDIVAVAIIILNAKSLVTLLKSRLFLIFLLLACVNIVFSLSPEVAMYKWLKTFEFLFLFFILRKEKLDFGVVAKVFVASTLIQLILVAFQFESKRSLQGIFYFLGERYFTLSTPGIAKASLNGIEILRPYGSFSHPNSMGGFYVLVYTFFLVSANFQKNKLLKAAILCMSSMLVFLSFSKVAITTYVIVSIAFLSKSKLYKDCILCFISRLGFLLVIPTLFLLAHGDPESLQKRTTLLVNSLTIFWQRPFFGTGLGNYLIAQSQFPIPYSYYFLQPVHNIFLLFLTETGVFLTGFLGYLFYYYQRFLLKNRKLLYLLFVITFTGLFDHYWLTLQQNALLATVLFALILNEVTLKRGAT